MSFPINVGIPAANNDPADDQPLIKQNFQNISDYLTIDHVRPGAAKDGFHKQITYANYFPPIITPPATTPTLPLDPVSIAYSDKGVADPGHPENFWRNSQGIFPLSAVRAFGLINAKTGVGNPTVVSGFNIKDVNYSISGGFHIFTIDVQPGAVSGLNPSLFVISQGSGVYTYSYSSNQIILKYLPAGGVPDPTLFNVLLLQI